MEKIISAVIIIMTISLFGSSSVFAQKVQNNKSVVSDTIHVHGVCDMCKDRIENAALIKGVKKATWDKKTHELVVFYKPSIVSIDKIEHEIAHAGHDTEHLKADEKVYNSLPECCAYRSGEIDPH